MTVWLAPATEENIATSIDQPVPWEFVEGHLPQRDVAALRRGGGTDGVFCWAMTQGSKFHFDSMEVGDEVLITPRGTGLFTRYAQVYYKTTSMQYGKALWPKSGENPWQHLFFLKNIQAVNLIKKEVLRDAGYNNSKDVLSGIRPVTDQRLAALLRGAHSLRQRLGLPEPSELDSKELTEESGLLAVHEESDAGLNREVTEDQYQEKVNRVAPVRLPDGALPALEQVKVGDRMKYLSDPRVSKAALVVAGFQCEFDDAHITFKNAISGKQHMEAHHLIPLSKQGLFEVRLDVPENILSLCPTCHRMIHLADDSERKPAIYKAYRLKEERLASRGIDINLKDLYRLYDFKICPVI